jgi:hypothetical protein
MSILVISSNTARQKQNRSSSLEIPAWILDIRFLDNFIIRHSLFDIRFS